jgi:hypothetical protein
MLSSALPRPDPYPNPRSLQSKPAQKMQIKAVTIIA